MRLSRELLHAKFLCDGQHVTAAPYTDEGNIPNKALAWRAAAGTFWFTGYEDNVNKAEKHCLGCRRKISKLMQKNRHSFFHFCAASQSTK